MTWWIWVLIAFALLALEMASTTMHLGLFAIGALTVAILAALGVALPISSQLLIFTVVSVVALVFIRPMLVRKLNFNPSKPVDSIVGETAIALDAIGPAELGKAELRGTTWSARNVGTSAITKGQRCTVDRVDGLMLHVRG
jgi:membrane protein implicated in regulation of membrane protease activity